MAITQSGNSISGLVTQGGPGAAAAIEWETGKSIIYTGSMASLSYFVSAVTNNITLQPQGRINTGDVVSAWTNIGSAITGTAGTPAAATLAENTGLKAYNEIRFMYSGTAAATSQVGFTLRTA